MITQENLNKYVDAAKLIEHDGVDGVESASNLVGPEVAAGMLVSHLMAKKSGIFPVTEDIKESVKNEFLESSLID